MARGILKAVGSRGVIKRLDWRCSEEARRLMNFHELGASVANEYPS